MGKRNKKRRGKAAEAAPGIGTGLGLAVFSAVLARLPHPAPGWPVLAFFCLAPFFFAVTGQTRMRRVFVIAFVFGTLYFALVLDWMRVFPKWAGPGAVYGGWAVFALYHGFFLALFLTPLAFFRQRLPAGRGIREGMMALGAASLWTLFDAFRSVGWHANTLGWLGYTQAGCGPALHLARYVGCLGVTFVLVLGNAFLAGGLRAAIIERRIRAGAVLGGLFALLFLGGLLGNGPSPGPPGAVKTLDVALYQPGVAQERKLDYSRAGEIKAAYVGDIARFREGNAPGLLVLPETLVLEFLPDDADFLYALARAARTEALFGTPRRDPEAAGRFYNSVLLMDAQGGVIGVRDKERLVPLYEYTPFAGALGGLLGPPRTRAWEYSPGEVTGPVDKRLGAAVCFESTLPGILRKQTRQGAELLVVVTNDAWFAGTSFAQRHFRAAVFRAAENGRCLVQAANTGVTAVVGPAGAVEKTLPKEKTGFLAATVSLERELTVYTRYGYGFPVPAALMAGLLFSACAIRKRKPRGKRG